MISSNPVYKSTKHTFLLLDASHIESQVKDASYAGFLIHWRLGGFYAPCTIIDFVDDAKAELSASWYLRAAPGRLSTE
jgi:hypothetical protein